MLRFIGFFLLLLPFLALTFTWFDSPANYGAKESIFAAANKGASAQKQVDPLRLKREDLIEGEDRGWFPELNAVPEDFIEEMELPKRAENADETQTS